MKSLYVHTNKYIDMFPPLLNSYQIISNNQKKKKKKKKKNKIKTSKS